MRDEDRQRYLDEYKPLSLKDLLRAQGKAREQRSRESMERTIVIDDLLEEFDLAKKNYDDLDQRFNGNFGIFCC